MVRSSSVVALALAASLSAFTLGANAATHEICWEADQREQLLIRAPDLALL